MATVTKKDFSKDLTFFRDCLQKAETDKNHLLPNAVKKEACNVRALVGDSLLRTAAVKELVVSDHRIPEDKGKQPSVEDTTLRKLNGLTVGYITSRINQTVSNKHLAGNSGDILLGVERVDVSANDLEGLSLHQKATAVEAAVAMVQAQFGEAPIRALARELIRRSQPEHNWKGMFMEMEGEVVCEKIGKNGYVATATHLNNKDHQVYKSGTWPTEVEAEQDAAKQNLLQEGMLSPSDSPPCIVPNKKSNWTGILNDLGGSVTAYPELGQGPYHAEATLCEVSVQSVPHDNKKDAKQEASMKLLMDNDLWQHASRVAFKEKKAIESMEAFSRTAAAQVDASWLKEGMKNLVFYQLGINEDSTTAKSSKDGAKWFIEKALKKGDCFRALILAPLVLSNVVKSVYIWGANIQGSKVDGGDSTDADCNKEDGSSTDVTTSPGGSVDGDSRLVKEEGRCVAVALVTVKSDKAQPGEAQPDKERWFVGQTQPSMNQAKSNVAWVAIRELGLIDRARGAPS